MATKRKSFIVHKDSLSVLDELSNEQAGLLFKAIKSYQDDGEADLDSLTKIIFSPFRAQFERDNEKYQKIVDRNKNNGAKGGRPKTEPNPENPVKPSGLKHNPENPVKPDSVSDSKNDSDSDSKNEVNKDLSVPDRKLNPEDVSFATWFYERLVLINPKQKKPTKAAFEKWADVIRLIRVADNKTYQEMSDLFMWVNSNEFWKGNILSPAKFRKHWDMLIIQMNKEVDQSQPRQFSKAAEKTINNIIDVELD